MDEPDAKLRRRFMPPLNVADAIVGAVFEPRESERLGDAAGKVAAAKPVKPSEESRGSRARSGPATPRSPAARGRARAGTDRDRRRRRCRASTTVPESGRISVAIMPSVVDLPAPFGPSSPKHSPRPHLEAQPVDGDESPKRFVTSTNLEGRGFAHESRVIRTGRSWILAHHGAPASARRYDLTACRSLRSTWVPASP